MSKSIDVLANDYTTKQIGERPDFTPEMYEWDEVNDAYKAGYKQRSDEDGWTEEKPKTFKENCILLTANWFSDHWEIMMFEILLSDGENDKGEPAYYWGVFQDGDEWGDYDDIGARLYKIVEFPKPLETKR